MGVFHIRGLLLVVCELLVGMAVIFLTLSILQEITFFMPFFFNLYFGVTINMQCDMMSLHVLIFSYLYIILCMFDKMMCFFLQYIGCCITFR